MVIRTSSRNSEVIHAETYYPRNSLKAKLCVQGKRLLYDYCQARSIPHQKIGKIIVATTAEQLMSDLPTIQSRAEANGIFDLKLLSSESIRLIEPEINRVGGLFSTSSGIVDSHMLLLSLLADADNNGALALNSPCWGGEILPQIGVILFVDDLNLSCDLVINCGGLYVHQIWNKILQKKDPLHWNQDYRRSLTMTK